MKKTDHSRLVAKLAEEYSKHAPKSAAIHERAKKHLIDGGSHALRLIYPFPPRPVSAQGAWITDEDGNRIMDFWQGHFANILGHNPEVVTSVLAEAFEGGYGLQTGFEDRVEVEAAEILCQQTGAERVRFTTSGTLATMYAALLSFAFTGRDMAMKVGAGWHGGHPWGLKGVGFRAGEGIGFQHVDTAGLPLAVTEKVVVTRFNDPERLREDFREYGDRLACFTVEPFIGAGGCIPATKEYLQTARELTQQYGVVLIFDEVIAGFRFRAGDLGSLYGIRPDLTTFGKAIGGGMPVAALAGREEILRLVGSDGDNKVKFSGGTYSAHPASMLAAKTFMEHLVAHEEEVYPLLARLGNQARRQAETAFSEEGIYVRCTGHADGAFPGGSLSLLAFPYDEGLEIRSPEHVRNPEFSDVQLAEQVLQLALLVDDVHTMHGLGAVSAAHTAEDLSLLGEKYRRVARLFKQHI
jgi:glutamate-1-semialdehyde 2,1-aminomutase